jgi:hypothetical protein
MVKSRALAIRVAFSLVCASISSVAADSFYEQFRNPPASYSLMPYWYWNGRITPSDTRREMEAMISQGVTQAIAFSWDGMSMRYLSEDYWQQVGAALDIARELHFTLNFADEYDWPSGHAWTPPENSPEISKVLREHPEYRMQRLEYSEETITGPRRWDRDSASEFAVAMNGASLILIESPGWTAPPGSWLITTYKRVPAVGGHNTRVDLLNRDAVRAYIDLVYEEFARRFSRHFGKTLQLTVADHEGSYGVPIAWTPPLWSTFKSRHGYDLRTRLPLLVHDGPNAHQVRQDYFDTVSALYTGSFSKQVADWCSAHGLKHATSLYEEQLYIQVGQAGNMFDHWRASSAVEIDALLERARMPLDFKEAVSVAHFDRKPLLVENQGLQGHATYFSLEKARLGSNMALLWGANTLVPYFDYDQHKVTWPPQWFLSQPFWPYFRHYADYVRRAQFMNAQGEHIAPVLIYYPLETAYANASTLLQNKPHRDLFWNNSMDQTQNYYSALQLELAHGGWDYHIADAYYLQRATVQQGRLRIGDEYFSVLILPPMTDLDPRSAKKIAEFEHAGGLVLRVTAQQRKPFMDRLNYMEQIEVPTEVRGDLAPVLDALRRVQPPQLQVTGAREHLYFSHRRRAGRDWYWVVNDSDQPHTVRVQGGPYEKWDAETGERSAIGDELSFGPWDAYFIVRGGSDAPVQQVESVLETLLDTGWHFTPEKDIEIPYRDGVWLSGERLSKRDWWINGPFPYDDHRGFFTAYPPEHGFDESAGWRRFESPAYSVTLPKGGIFYAYGKLNSPIARDAEIVTAFADSEAVWWNGQEVMRVHRHPKWSLLRDPWAERVPVHVRHGENEVLLKIGPSLMVSTAFMFRLVDRQGNTLRDLWKTDEYPEHPIRVPARTVPFTLHSWTDDPQLAHYSGAGVYETTFELGQTEGKVELDLGAVGVAAEVWVNDQPCGSRVWRPFRFDISKALRAGKNTLKVRVVNSDANWQAQGTEVSN